ncbi:MAG: hypothetical protein AAF806_15510 [Bacteroidota bacterium]
MSIKIRLLFLLLFGSSFAFSQSTISQDTLFVYDTIYVTDTVFLNRTFSEISELEKVSLQEILSGTDSSKILLFSEDKTATFLTSRIITVDNQLKNTVEMKKLSFIGLFVFALQTMIFSQHDIGVVVGGGIHHLDAQLGTSTQTDWIPQGFFGISYRKPFAKDWLAFQADLRYHYLKGSDFSGDFHYRLRSATADLSADAHLFSLPANLQLTTKYLHLGGGVEFYHKRSPNIVNVQANAQSQEVILSRYKLPVNGFNLTANMGIPIGKRIILNASYSRALTNEFTIVNARFQNENLTLKQERIELGLRYRLY